MNRVATGMVCAALAGFVGGVGGFWFAPTYASASGELPNKRLFEDLERADSVILDLKRELGIIRRREIDATSASLKEIGALRQMVDASARELGRCLDREAAR